MRYVILDSELEDIPGYEGRYAITRDGKVYSYPKGRVNKSGRWLNPWFNHDDYLVVELDNHSHSIHRLLALTYIPNPCNRSDVDHIDNDKLNNNLDNLQWLSRAENVKKSQNVPVKCYTDSGRCQIYYSMSEAARILGLFHGNITKVCKGLRRSCGKTLDTKEPLRWSYL